MKRKQKQNRCTYKFSTRLPKDAVPIYGYQSGLTIPKIIPSFSDDIVISYISPCIYVSDKDMSALLPVGIIDSPLDTHELVNHLRFMRETGIRMKSLNLSQKELRLLTDFTNKLVAHQDYEFECEIAHLDPFIMSPRNEQGKPKKGDAVWLNGGIYGVSDQDILLYLGPFDFKKLQSDVSGAFNDIMILTAKALTGSETGSCVLLD